MPFVSFDAPAIYPGAVGRTVDDQDVLTRDTDLGVVTRDGSFVEQQSMPVVDSRALPAKAQPPVHPDCPLSRQPVGDDDPYIGHDVRIVWAGRSGGGGPWTLICVRCAACSLRTTLERFS